MALGRGLESLLKNVKNEPDWNITALTQLNVDEIKPNPDQPRQSFDQESLNELAQSIKNYGVLEPIIVRKEKDNYLIVAGERRWRAVKLLGQTTIPAIITDNRNNILELSIIENLQREDLNIIDLAEGYEFLINEYRYTHKELAERLGKSRTSITNVLRLLNLSEEVLEMIRNKDLSYGKARPLLAIKDEEMQSEIAHQIKNKDLTARQVENLIHKLLSETPPTLKPKEDNIFVGKINDWLSEKYDTNVSIKLKKEKGKVEFKFDSLEQLNSLIKALGYSDDII